MNDDAYTRAMDALEARTERIIAMKPNTTIREDNHGPYVRTNGQVYRPHLSRWSYPVMQPLYHDQVIVRPPKDLPDGVNFSRVLDHAYEPDPKLFVEGERVKARAVSQTPYAVVETPDGRKAYWWGHGVYTNPPRPTDACWAPKEQ